MGDLNVSSKHMNSDDQLANILVQIDIPEESSMDSEASGQRSEGRAGIARRNLTVVCLDSGLGEVRRYFELQIRSLLGHHVARSKMSYEAGETTEVLFGESCVCVLRVEEVEGRKSHYNVDILAYSSGCD